ncbi:MAG: hypothetical protein HYR66_15160 [Sphingobacteriales bacterium]|nr:hypothetical protein [Sphingobacteriales bacterium]MBI3717455.1 hypothetical protein [Sphingobacteriales bacterium]
MPFEFNKLLDAEFLNALYLDDFLYAEEVFGNFLKQNETEIRVLDTLVLKGDTTKFRSQLHKIKPTFSLVGLGILTAESEKLIELCDKTPELEIIVQQYKTWQLLVNEWMPYVQKEYQRLQSYNQEQ